MKKLSLILALSLMLSLLSACGGGSSDSGVVSREPVDLSTPTIADTSESGSGDTQEYVLDCGATLTAKAGLTEVAMESLTTTLQGDDMLVTFLDENKQTLGGDLTLETYADLVASINGVALAFAEDAMGNLATTYTREVDGATYFYYATVHETNSSFWLIQMACLDSERADFEPLFMQWCSTITLADTELDLSGEITEATYQLSCGLSITAAEGMVETAVDGYDTFLQNNQAAVLILKEEKPEGWSLEDYAAAVSEANGLSAFEADEYGTLYTAHAAESSGINYIYYITVHETEDCFVLCQIYTSEALIDYYGPYFPAWSASLQATA